MTRVVRTFLMWLMLLALPVQGMAQVSMFACHLKGGNNGTMSMMSHAAMENLNSSHTGMDRPMHDMSDMGSMAGHDHHPDSDAAKKLMKSLHGCCNCAPTCAVVLLPVTQTNFSAVLQDELHPISASQLPNSADTRRIDRPPKTLAI